MQKATNTAKTEFFIAVVSPPSSAAAEPWTGTAASPPTLPNFSCSETRRWKSCAPRRRSRPPRQATGRASGWTRRCVLARDQERRRSWDSIYRAPGYQTVAMHICSLWHVHSLYDSRSKGGPFNLHYLQLFICTRSFMGPSFTCCPFVYVCVCDV